MHYRHHHHHHHHHHHPGRVRCFAQRLQYPRALCSCVVTHPHQQVLYVDVYLY
jgi:hypothetical protein